MKSGSMNMFFSGWAAKFTLRKIEGTCLGFKKNNLNCVRKYLLFVSMTMMWFFSKSFLHEMILRINCKLWLFCIRFCKPKKEAYYHGILHCKCLVRTMKDFTWNQILVILKKAVGFWYTSALKHHKNSSKYENVNCQLMSLENHVSWVAENYFPHFECKYVIPI